MMCRIAHADDSAKLYAIISERILFAVQRIRQDSCCVPVLSRNTVSGNAGQAQLPQRSALAGQCAGIGGPSGWKLECSSSDSSDGIVP